MSCFFMYMNIHIYKNGRHDDDDDALLLSATYCELMHINLHRSVIGSSLIVPAQCSLCVNASIEIHFTYNKIQLSYQRSSFHSSASHRVCVCVCV